MTSIKTYALILLGVLFLQPASAESLYVAYKWATPGASSFTESWNLVNTSFPTDTAVGMEKLIAQIAQQKGVETVQIIYIRQLRGVGKQRSKDVFI